MKDGIAKMVGDNCELRFVRDLPHPIEKVWSALTEPARIADWLAADAHMDLRVGGRVHMGEHDIESTVTDIDPPKLIQYGWSGPKMNDGGQVRWELDQVPDGTHLVLTHVFRVMSDAEVEEFRSRFDRFELPEGWEPRSSTMAGWHTLLERLGVALDGGKANTFDMERWQELNEHYKEVPVR